jgi:hypothetical protein
MSLWTVATIVFLFNVPFGYWRAGVRKFSAQWILSIHLPVPLVIALRMYSGLGWRFITFPVLIGAFFGGQFVGGRLREWRRRRVSGSNQGEHAGDSG